MPLRFLAKKASPSRARLHGVALFANCSERDLRRLEHLGTSLRVGRERQLTLAGDTGREVIVVLQGCAQCSVDDRQVATLTAGDCFGEVADLDGGPCAATVTAVTDMELLVYTRSEFRQLVHRAPVVAFNLLSLLAERLRSAGQPV